MTNQILPSLLAADLISLGEEINALINAGIQMVHLDVMDNHYVPNLTFGPQFCSAIHHHFKKII